MDARHYNHEKLAKLREEKGWTQDFVANKLKVVRETITRVDTGRNASYDILCDYTELLDCDVTEILHPRPIALAA